MILTKDKASIVTQQGKLSIGDRVLVANGDYAGLKGSITDIRTGSDKETENETDDVYCWLDIPEEPEKVQLLEKHFSDLFGYPKKLEDLSLDVVILAPDMLSLLSEV